jgi:hypothetical protein
VTVTVTVQLSVELPAEDGVVYGAAPGPAVELELELGPDVELELDVDVALAVGKGTVVFAALAVSPPAAPVAFRSESALASLVQATSVPGALTDGRAKHCWVAGQGVVAHAAAHWASAPAMHAVCPAEHGSVALRAANWELRSWAS